MVWTLIDNGKLANQIARLATKIVVEKEKFTYNNRKMITIWEFLSPPIQIRD